MRSQHLIAKYISRNHELLYTLTEDTHDENLISKNAIVIRTTSRNVP
jgi:hypothetical protein